MIDPLSIILVLCATILNALIFGYVASNAKKNTTNQAYLIFLSFIILYTIFDCIIIQTFNSNSAKHIIIKIQAALWMPLSITFLNFTYHFLRKTKDEIFYLFVTTMLVSLFITIITNKVLLGYKDFNLGTMANTGSWFLPITCFGILPPAIYAIYLIGKESGLFVLGRKRSKKTEERLLSLQLKILFFGSMVCLMIAVITNIFLDEFFGYSGELHLASLSLSIQSIFLLPALIKYNFLNQPIEQLVDELYATSSDAVFIVNYEGIILNLNKSARKIFLLRGKINNININSLFTSHFSHTLEKDNYETITKKGKYVTISQTNITQGNLSLGKILVIRDITQRKIAEEELIKSEESYKNLIKSSGDIIYNLDLEGKFTFVNAIFEKVTGYARKEVLGKDTNIIVIDDYKNKKAEIFNILYKNKSNDLQTSIKTQVQIITKNKKPLWMELGISTIVKEKKITGFSVISRDITERKTAENKLLQITKELRTAQDVAVLGSFIYDIKNNIVTWSENLYKIYELDQKTFIPSKDNFLNKVVHPESREYITKTVNDALINGLEQLDYIHKSLTPSGEEKWMHAIIKIRYDKNKQAIIMNGTSQDITELYTIRLNLEKSELRLKKAQEIANLGAWEENHKTGHLYWSPILRKMFSVDLKKIIAPDQFWEMVHPEDIKWMKESWKNAEKKQRPYSGTFRIILKNGKVKHLNEHAEFIKDKKGNLFKTIGTVIDVTEIHNYQNELKELSSHIQELQEKERGHIAREIHDELGQRLTSINMDIAFIKNKLYTKQKHEVNKRLNILSNLVEETIAMTRKLSQELRPTILDDLGLVDAIDWLKEQYSQRTDINFTLNVKEKDIQINNEHATAVFRIAQEALTNIIKHAKAKNVNINIGLGNSLITLQVKDDGIGISEITKQEQGKTYGVFGMQERASSLGGQLNIKNNNNKGTSVNLILPYNPN